MGWVATGQGHALVGVRSKEEEPKALSGAKQLWPLKKASASGASDSPDGDGHHLKSVVNVGDGALAGFGSNGGIVEVDETFIGKEPGVTKAKNARGGSHKMKMLTLVDRSTKRAKSIVIDDLKKSTLIPILIENSREVVATDEGQGRWQRV
ncbi:MAG: transposase [Rhodobacter sp.]|nr:transposase [Rhodobacter sp.]